jgi:hypothetical protein
MKSKLVERWGAAVGCLALAAAVVAASETAKLDKTYPSTSSPRITVSNLAGKVTVKGWDKNQVHAVCTSVSPHVEVDTDAMPAHGDAQTIHFATHVLDPQPGAQDATADYTLEIPAGSSLEVQDPEGSVTIEGLRGDVWVESVGAPVSVADVAGHLAVRSVGGAIEVTRPSGRVELFSVTGDLRLLSPASSQVRAETTSGHIFYRGDFAPSGDYVLSSYRGDVDVLCPSTASFQLRARTVRGKPDVDPALRLNRPEHHMPQGYGSAIFGFRNSGAATVELRSYSGNIHVRADR